MQPPPLDTALLVFSRSARSDAAAKPLSGHTARQDQAVARQFIGHTRVVASEAGLPVFWVDERQQNGQSFGERLANAMEAIYDRGYGQVIAIGNDCPALTAANLRLAAAWLTKATVVLGPAADGGVYLVGIARAAYDRAKFLAVHWQTDTVLYDLSALAGGQACLLAAKADVDSPADLLRQLRQDRLPMVLKISLLNLLGTIVAIPANADFRRPNVVLRSCPLLRGPPTFQRQA